MDLMTLLLMECAVFAASLVGGLTGFGFALILTPNLMLLLPPKTTIPIAVLLSMLLTIVLFYEVHSIAKPKEISQLIVSGIIGTILGSLLLVYIYVPLLKLLIGVIIVPFALAQLLDFKINIDSKVFQIPVGLLSGFLGGATSMSGPPVVLFFQNMGYDKRVFRANLVSYFLLLYPFSLPTYWFSGLITADVIYSTAITAPAMIIGTLLGSRLVHRVNERIFRTITLILVIVSGLFSIVTSLSLF